MSNSSSYRSKRRKIVKETDLLLKRIRSDQHDIVKPVAIKTRIIVEQGEPVVHQFNQCGDFNVSFSDSDENQIDDCAGDSLNLSDQLKAWACLFNITQCSIDSLLTILKPYFNNELPSCARTLLRTPREVEIQNLCGGEYFYFGLKNNVITRLKQGLSNDYVSPFVSKLRESIENLITVTIGCDGIPISKSNNYQFWPLMGILNESKNKKPFVIALFYGKTKPRSSNEYLEPFVTEMQNLYVTGIEHNNSKHNIRISCFIADAPARSFLKYCKNHNAYFGCEKCNVEGEWLNRVVYLELNSLLRTDFSFLNQIHEDHHTGESCLTKLQIGMVSQFPADYMHLICLGVMRKSLYSWIKGPLNVRIPSKDIGRISELLLQFVKHSPCDFSRKPRSLSEVQHFKATEYRMFLLYTGPVCLRGILPKTLYKHFLLLSTSVFILLSPAATNCKFNKIAQTLLLQYVNESKQLYGNEFVTYNVHTLIHIASDSLNFGCLDNFSAFDFENFMQFFKRILRGRKHSLKQVVNRVTEIEFALTGSHDVSSYSSASGYVLKSNKTKYRYKGILISVTVGDNCFLTNDLDVIILTGLDRLEENVVTCRKFLHKNNLEDYPIDSSLLCIFKCRVLSDVVEIPFSSIFKKCFALPDRQNPEWFTCIPLTYEFKITL